VDTDSIFLIRVYPCKSVSHLYSDADEHRFSQILNMQKIRIITIPRHNPINAIKIGLITLSQFLSGN